MGGTTSSIKKDEIVNWYIKNKSGFFSQAGTLTGALIGSKFDLELHGNLVLRDKTKDEIKEKISDIQQKTKNFIEKDSLIGTFGKNGDLEIESIIYDKNKNYIFSIKKGSKNYTLNFSRKERTLLESSNDYKAFLVYADQNTTGNTKKLAFYLCETHNAYKSVRKKSSHLSIGGIQLGGGENVYNYIINPTTNRKVRLDGKLGKEVLRNYMNLLNNE